jgi:Arc/MetJ-type ribon-helix-helix transcriptional regulator
MTIEMPQSDEVIRQRTGKTWAEWRETLDAWGAADKGHTEIAAYVSGDLGIDDWWAQGVTVGYERMIGRRAVGQRNDGSYSASASKTVNAGVEDVHAALVDDEARAAWLGDGVLTLRTSSAPKSVRFDDLQAGVIIAFFLTDKGEKTAVQVQADKFASQDAADAWKAMWKPRLNALAKRFS